MPDNQSSQVRSVFGTRIPSTVVFAIGLLLFTLPFAELKCKPSKTEHDVYSVFNTIGLSVTNTGLGLALGSKWHIAGENLFQNETAEVWKKKARDQKPNTYATVALIMAVLSLALSFVNKKSMAVVTTVTGGIAAGALIGLLIDLKRKSSDIVSQFESGTHSSDGSQLHLVMIFTPWFYIAIIAMLTACAFSYKRILSGP